MKRSINKKMILRLAAQANEADLYGSHHIADNLTYILTKYAEEGNVRDDDTGYEYNKEELVKDVETMLWDAATRVFDYYDELPDGRDIEDFVSSFTSEYMRGLDNIIHSKIGKHEPNTPGEEKSEENPDEVVHWEIKFEVADDGDEDDDEERSTFVLEDPDEEEKDEDEEHEEHGGHGGHGQCRYNKDKDLEKDEDDEDDEDEKEED